MITSIKSFIGNMNGSFDIILFLAQFLNLLTVAWCIGRLQLKWLQLKPPQSLHPPWWRHCLLNFRIRCPNFLLASFLRYLTMWKICQKCEFVFPLLLKITELLNYFWITEDIFYFSNWRSFWVEMYLHTAGNSTWSLPTFLWTDKFCRLCSQKRWKRHCSPVYRLRLRCKGVGSPR